MVYKSNKYEPNQLLKSNYFAVVDNFFKIKNNFTTFNFYEEWTFLFFWYLRFSSYSYNWKKEILKEYNENFFLKKTKFTLRSKLKWKHRFATHFNSSDLLFTMYTINKLRFRKNYLIFFENKGKFHKILWFIDKFRPLTFKFFKYEMFLRFKIFFDTSNFKFLRTRTLNDPYTALAREFKIFWHLKKYYWFINKVSEFRGFYIAYRWFKKFEIKKPWKIKYIITDWYIIPEPPEGAFDTKKKIKYIIFNKNFERFYTKFNYRWDPFVGSSELSYTSWEYYNWTKGGYSKFWEHSPFIKFEFFWSLTVVVKLLVFYSLQLCSFFFKASLKKFKFFNKTFFSSFFKKYMNPNKPFVRSKSEKKTWEIPGNAYLKLRRVVYRQIFYESINKTYKFSKFEKNLFKLAEINPFDHRYYWRIWRLKILGISEKSGETWELLSIYINFNEYYSNYFLTVVEKELRFWILKQILFWWKCLLVLSDQNWLFFDHLSLLSPNWEIFPSLEFNYKLSIPFYYFGPANFFFLKDFIFNDNILFNDSYINWFIMYVYNGKNPLELLSLSSDFWNFSIFYWWFNSMSRLNYLVRVNKVFWVRKDSLLMATDFSKTLFDKTGLKLHEVQSIYQLTKEKFVELSKLDSSDQFYSIPPLIINVLYFIFSERVSSLKINWVIKKFVIAHPLFLEARKICSEHRKISTEQPKIFISKFKKAVLKYLSLPISEPILDPLFLYRVYRDNLSSNVFTESFFLRRQRFIDEAYKTFFWLSLKFDYNTLTNPVISEYWLSKMRRFLFLESFGKFATKKKLYIYFSFVYFFFKLKWYNWLENIFIKRFFLYFFFSSNYISFVIKRFKFKWVYFVWYLIWVQVFHIPTTTIKEFDKVKDYLLWFKKLFTPEIEKLPKDFNLQNLFFSLPDPIFGFVNSIKSKRYFFNTLKKSFPWLKLKWWKIFDEFATYWEFHKNWRFFRVKKNFLIKFFLKRLKFINHFNFINHSCSVIIINNFYSMCTNSFFYSFFWDKIFFNESLLSTNNMFIFTKLLFLVQNNIVSKESLLSIWSWSENFIFNLINQLYFVYNTGNLNWFFYWSLVNNYNVLFLLNQKLNSLLPVPIDLDYNVMIDFIKSPELNFKSLYKQIPLDPEFDLNSILDNIKGDYYNFGSWSFPVEVWTGWIIDLNEISSKNDIFDENSNISSKKKKISIYIDYLGRAHIKLFFNPYLSIKELYYLIEEEFINLCKIYSFWTTYSSAWFYFSTLSCESNTSVLRAFLNKLKNKSKNIIFWGFVSSKIWYLNIKTFEIRLVVDPHESYWLKIFFKKLKNHFKLFQFQVFLFLRQFYKRFFFFKIDYKFMYFHKLQLQSLTLINLFYEKINLSRLNFVIVILKFRLSWNLSKNNVKLDIKRLVKHNFYMINSLFYKFKIYKIRLIHNYFDWHLLVVKKKLSNRFKFFYNSIFYNYTNTRFFKKSSISVIIKSKNWLKLFLNLLLIENHLFFFILKFNDFFFLIWYYLNLFDLIFFNILKINFWYKKKIIFKPIWILWFKNKFFFRLFLINTNNFFLPHMNLKKNLLYLWNTKYSKISIFLIKKFKNKFFFKFENLMCSDLRFLNFFSNTRVTDANKMTKNSNIVLENNNKKIDFRFKWWKNWKKRFW